MKRVNLKLEDDLHAQLKEESITAGITLQDYIVKKLTRQEAAVEKTPKQTFRRAVQHMPDEWTPEHVSAPDENVDRL